MKTRLVSAISAFFCLLAFLLGPAALQAAPKAPGYAIVVPTDHPELNAAVQALRTKHAALGPKVFYYRRDVREVLPDLREMLPYYTCFVTPKELAGRAFTGEVSRLAREITPDPYCDTFWGILTGYDTADLRRVAEFKGPINITDALDMVGGGG